MTKKEMKKFFNQAIQQESFLDFYTKDGKHLCKVYETALPDAWVIQDDGTLTFMTFQELVQTVLEKIMEWNTHWAHDMYDDVSTPQKATLKLLFSEAL